MKKRLSAALFSAALVSIVLSLLLTVRRDRQSELAQEPVAELLVSSERETLSAMDEALPRVLEETVADSVAVRGGELETRLVMEPEWKYPLIREEVLPNGTVYRMVADHLMVRLKDGVALSDLDGLLSEESARVRRTMPLSGLVMIEFDGRDLSKMSQLMARLNNEPDLIEFAEIDGMIKGTSVTPNDPRYSNGTQWGANQISAPAAWAVTQGRNDVVVGIADSGIMPEHEEMMGQLWTNTGEIPDNGIDDDNNGLIDDYYGYDFLDEDGDPYDVTTTRAELTGHGTQQASIVAAKLNNNKGIAGYAPEARIMSLRILRATSGGPEGVRSDAIESLYYAAMMRERGVNIRVTNHSWAGPETYEIDGQVTDSVALTAAVQANADLDMLVVAAAGNNGQDRDVEGIFVPGGLPLDNVINVAATTSADVLASFSNYGAVSVDLAAPGKSIWSARNYATDDYRAADGTSPAAPHVAAAAALCFSVAPADVSYTEIRNAILNGVDALPSLSGKVATGGRLNLLNAVQNIMGSAAGPYALSSSPEQTLTDQSFNHFEFVFDKDMDTSSFALSDVRSFTGPSGALTATGFSWLDVRTLRLTFAGQRAAGVYQMAIGPQILDTSSNPMDHDLDGTTGEDVDDQFAASVTLAATSAGPKVVKIYATVSSGAPTAFNLLFSESIDAASYSSASDLLALEAPSGKDISSAITSEVWSLDNKMLTLNVSGQTRSGFYRILLDSAILAAGDGQPLDQDCDGVAGEATDDQAAFNVLALDGMIQAANGYSVYFVSDKNLALTEGAPGVDTVYYNNFGNLDFSLGAHTLRMFDADHTGSKVYTGELGLLALESNVSTGDDLGFTSQYLASYPQQALISPYWMGFPFAMDDTSSFRQFEFQDRDGDSQIDHLVVDWQYVSFAGSDPMRFQALIQLNTGTKPGTITFAYPDLEISDDTFGDLAQNGESSSVGIRPTEGSGTFGPEVLQISFKDTSNPFVSEGNTIEIGKPGSIGGRVYTDTNLNSQWDTGELGDSGRTVYIDANGNDALDAGEESTTTDSDGWYSFGPLAWADCDVRVVPGADTFLSALELTVTLDPDERDTGNDFRLDPNQAPIATTSVAAGSDGGEQAPTAIDFTLSRADNFTETFTLNFTLSGSSVGADYTVTGADSWNSGAQTGTVIFSPGELQEVITVTPVQDSDVEGTETVQFNIETGTGYVAGTASDSASILDAQTNYPPTVSLLWPDGSSSVSATLADEHWLEVSVVDDGFGSLTYGWSQISGPGTASFGSDSTAGTTVSADVAGTYVLRATVIDGTNTETVDVTVKSVSVSAVSSTDRIVYLDLDESSGSTADDSEDSDGESNDGTVGGTVTWTPSGGVHGGALDFNGTSGYLGFSDSDSINSTGPFPKRTVSLWFKADDVSGRQVLFGEGGTARGLNIYLEGSTLYVGGWNNNENGWNQTYLTQTGIVAGVWNHVALVLDATPGGSSLESNVLIGYLNGSEFDSGSGAPLNAHNADTGIGAMNDGSRFHDNGSGETGNDHYFDGLIDEFLLYNRALSSVEIGSLYNSFQVNTIPSVAATADATVDVNTSLSLDGTVSDAESTPTSAWRMLSGPGVATFGNASAVDTTVSFDTAGSYVIALVANDGTMAGGALLSITATSGVPSPGFYDEADFDDWFANLPGGVTVDNTKKGFSETANGVLSNGMIFALGIDSLDPADAEGKLPIHEIADNAGDDHLEFVLRRRTGGSGSIIETSGYVADGVRYVVEISSTLANGSWASGAALLETAGSVTDNGDGTETVVVRVKQAIEDNGDGRDFIRLSITQEGQAD